MRSFVHKLLYFAQVHKLLRCLRRNKVIILTYHGFTESKIHEGIENHQGKHLAIEKFKFHLEYLTKYHPIISLDRLIDDYQQRKEPPDGAAVITFDDGYKSNYALAFPLLKQFNVPAAIFLTTSFVDGKKYLWTDRVEYAVSKANPGVFELNIEQDLGNEFSLEVITHDRDSRKASEKNVRTELKAVSQELRFKSVEGLENALGNKLSEGGNSPDIYQPLEWDEITEMVKSGLVSIGSHSHTHPILTRCKSDDLKTELFLSKDIIERKTDIKCRFFCYPNGQPGDFNDMTGKMLQDAGYACGLTTVPGGNDKDSDVFELKRIGVPYDGDRIDFIMNFYGVTQFLSNIKQSVLKLFNIGRTQTSVH